MTIKIAPSSIPYKEDVNIASYLLDDDKQISTKSIQQFVIIETGTLQVNQEIIADLSSFETPLKPLSLYVSTRSERDENMDITVNNMLSGTAEQVFKLYLNKSSIPYKFPDIVLFPFNQIVFKPEDDMDNCFLILEPAYVLHHLKLQGG